MTESAPVVVDCDAVDPRVRRRHVDHMEDRRGHEATAGRRPISRAGFPATTTIGGTGCVTTEPAPTTAPSPTSAITTALAPIHEPRPTRVGTNVSSPTPLFSLPRIGPGW